jgi:alpha-L-rhamnosidase
MSRYDDDTLTKEYYPVIKKWVEYLIKRAQKTKLFNRKSLPREHRQFILDCGWMWGEWLEPGQDSTKYMKELILHNDPEVGTAYLYYDSMIAMKMAKRLGQDEDAKFFENYAARVKTAYREVFAPDGKIKEQKRQCRYVRPLFMNLLDGDENQKNAGKLAELIKENGNRLNTGFLSTHELCRVLTKNGHSKTAYDLLLQEEQPGWLFAVKKGCTTIPESWNCFDEKGKPERSFNHYSYGAIVGWLIDGCAGINVADAKIEIAPNPDARLQYAKAVYESPLGRIVSEWKYVGGKVIYHMEIPANVTAMIRIPGQDEVQVTSGVYDF